MELASTVLSYYFTHAEALSPEKRFHLANRIAAWNGDGRAVALLHACREWFLPGEDDTAQLAAFEHANKVAHSNARYIVALELRRPYFDRYPALLGVEAELFRLRHLRELYGIDARELFLRRHPEAELRTLAQELLADETALRMLSTWAINFLYLFHREVLREDGGIDVPALSAIGQGYDTGDAEQLRLCLYFYTHCIIADSNFYAHDLPGANLPAYRGMLQHIEKLLADRLDQTSLDTKLEFLVCCRLAQYDTPLAADIAAECAQSVSPEGTFLIDTHNIFKDSPHKKSFEASEHRNVLFAMSVLPSA